MTVNHITVTGGTVGSINTGNIHRLNVAIDQAANRNDAALAEAIRALGSAVTNSTGLSAEQKDEATESLAFLVEQANTPNDRRQQSVIRAVKESFLRLLSVSADLMQVWATVGEPIRTALGLS